MIMTDEEIIALFNKRDEQAIASVQNKFGRYCGSIALNILSDREDMEECLSDTWLRAWNTIPPEQPRSLQAYLGCITRNLAISRFRGETAKKRAGSRFAAALDELTDACMPSTDNVAAETDRKALMDAINAFLDGQGERKRNIFIQRYFYIDSITAIAKRYDMTESAVKVTLFRMRGALKKELEAGGLM